MERENMRCFFDVEREVWWSIHKGIKAIEMKEEILSETLVPKGGEEIKK